MADNGLMNTMLGPETSRPLVQSLHACVAIGFVLGKYVLGVKVQNMKMDFNT